MATQIEKLLGAEGQDLLKGEKPTKKDIILLDEYLKKVHPNQRKQTDRVREIISRLKNNFSVWNQNEYELMSDKNISLRLSRLIASASNVSSHKAGKVKVNEFVNSSGDLFVFYQTTETPSEAPEPESRPLLCSQCSGPISLSLDISGRTEPDCLVSPARRPLERSDSYLLAASPALSVSSVHSDFQPEGADGWHPVKDDTERFRPANKIRERDMGTQTLPTDFKSGVEERNDLQLTNFIAVLEESEISVDKAARIGTALLKDLGYISPTNLQYIIDRNKIFRGKENVVAGVKADFEKKIREHPPKAIFFDSKVTMTNTTTTIEDEDGNVNEKRKKSQQDTYVVITEHEDLLGVFSVERGKTKEELAALTPAERKKEPKKMARVADQVFKILCDHDLKDSILAIGGDTCRPNTGWEGGAFQHLDKLLKRKTFHVECQFHIGELPMRRLAKSIIGKTVSGVKLEGEIFELMTKATNLKASDSFEIIPCQDWVEVPAGLIQELSSDQKYSMLIWKVIATGCKETLKKVINREVGPVVMSRWLTLACRACRVYISEDRNTLTDEDQSNLSNFVKFLVRVYFPNWFNVKQNSDITQGADNFLYFLELYRKWDPVGVKEEVILEVEENIKMNCYWAQSDKIILSLATSNDPRRRQQAVNLILKIRGENEFSDMGPTPVNYSAINIEARCLTDLIPISEFNREPIFTSNLTKQLINDIAGEKLTIDKIPGHSQACERMIRRMVESAELHWDRERQIDHIRARQFVKRRIPAAHPNKQDLVSLVEMDPPYKKGRLS